MAMTAEPIEQGGTLCLPGPTGTHPVGTTSVQLTDVSRSDPWVPEAGARELMVTLWYPTTSSNGRPARYMTPIESELLLRGGRITGVPFDVLSTTRTNAVYGAEPVGSGLPLVALSPGFGKPRATLTSLAEDLASNGYVVAGIDHTYESVATMFPDGRTTTCVAAEIPHDEAFWVRLGAGRAADVSFVLDQLIETHRGLIDRARIGMAGHSAGGAAAIATMLADRRVRAGIDIDGSTSSPMPDGGLARPFLFLGRQAQYQPGSGGAAATWEGDWDHLIGWRRWLTVTGALHASFTDVGLLAEASGLGTGAGLPATRVSEITRRYTRAFFDLHLRGEPQDVLMAPSARYPEVRFERPVTLPA
jgi:predicted dienelactone hydrolase